MKSDMVKHTNEQIIQSSSWKMQLGDRNLGFNSNIYNNWSISSVPQVLWGWKKKFYMTNIMVLFSYFFGQVSACQQKNNKFHNYSILDGFLFKMMYFYYISYQYCPLSVVLPILIFSMTDISKSFECTSSFSDWQ
jgi:hypothetical protein